jgi:hypothetical protein
MSFKHALSRGLTMPWRRGRDTIEIVDETTGFLMKESFSSPCVLTFQPGVNGDNLVAFLTGNDHASSNVLFTVPG